MTRQSRQELRVADVILTPCQGAFFYDDQVAIRNGAGQDGFLYRGAPFTPGFSAIRVPADAVSIGLVLSDQTIVWGDMVSVQYAGAAGRDPLFQTKDIIEITKNIVVPRLIGQMVSSFRSACASVLAQSLAADLPKAIAYGVSQALLRAAAYQNHRSMASVIVDEFALASPLARVPLYAQSGDDRYTNVDKMILKSVDVLPHGLINSKIKFGTKGETFLEFARWVKTRVTDLGGQGYRPRLHFDVYGWVGLAFENNISDVATFVARTADELYPLEVNIESPMDLGAFEPQLEGYAELVAELERLGSKARIVADEHCNTLDEIRAFADHAAAHIVQIKMPDVGSLIDAIDAVLYAKSQNVGAYVGGTCAETDLSALASTHVAFATQADMVLAKPGMGVDEGLCIVGNEQNRLQAQFQLQAEGRLGSSAELSI